MSILLSDEVVYLFVFIGSFALGAFYGFFIAKQKSGRFFYQYLRREVEDTDPRIRIHLIETYEEDFKKAIAEFKTY